MACELAGQQAHCTRAAHTTAGSTPPQPAMQARTWAGTHTIHSALSESQISERYFSAAADSGWPLTPAWRAGQEEQGRGRLGGMGGGGQRQG